MKSTFADNLFKRTVMRYFKQHGRRTLPWRTRQTPYRIFVSEMMLQQTQVERVIPKFNVFIKRFPNWQTLATASLPEVYALWQGLGYNRRAKYLRDAARLVVAQGRELPNDEAFIRSLPGVGPYMLGAIRAFAFGEPGAFVETNIRTAVIHHYFTGSQMVDDAAIYKILVRCLPRRGVVARNWYAALMDYGAHLKRSGLRLNARSVGYVKQSTFIGSRRQLRGTLLRELHQGGKTDVELRRITKRSMLEIREALRALCTEGLVYKQQHTFQLSA